MDPLIADVIFIRSFLYVCTATAIRRSRYGNDKPDPNGNDNRGSHGGLSSTDAVTDGSGVARVTFTVSMQPGDNFKVAASASSGRLALMTQKLADTSSPPNGVKLSEMLTVWRKLHVELDSMEAVATSGDESNQVEGQITSSSCRYDPNTGLTTIDLEQDLEACWEEDKEYHFENGRFWNDGGSESGYEVIRTIAHSGDDEIVVAGSVSPSGTCDYTLRDEDSFSLLPKYPPTAKLNSIFDDCYIVCEPCEGFSDNTVPFKRNLGGSLMTGDSIIDLTDPYRDSADYEAPSWWAVYICSAYQAGYTEDGDPDNEDTIGGGTETEHYEAAVTFVEHIRDAFATWALMQTRVEQQTVVHEIGHQVLEQGDHTPGTIMDAQLPVPLAEEKFSPEHIAVIRGQPTSPGN